MKIISWNLNSLKSKLPELQIIVTQNNPDIILLQETRLKPQENYLFKNFILHRKDIHDSPIARGGVLVAVKNNIYSEPVHLQTNLQAAAVTIRNPVRMTFCSIYLHQTDDISEDTLTHLIQQLPTPYIISGDFNAHNTLWRSQTTNIRGQNIEKFLHKTDVVLLNTGKNTHFNSYSGNFSAINLSICSSTLAHITTWNPLTSLHSSDHFPLLLNVETQNEQASSKFPTWKIKEADWTKFTRLVNLQLPANTTDINILYKLIVT